MHPRSGSVPDHQISQAGATSNATLKSALRESITFSADLSQARVVELDLGISSFPYLADHRFQDMIVLPGSFYLELALVVHREMFKETATALRNARFQNPIILSEDDTAIKIKMKKKTSAVVEYIFFESGAGESSAELDTPYFAKVEINSAQTGVQKNPANGFCIEEFQTRAASVINGADFYEQLRRNGNQYGPRFQNVSALWRFGDEVLGKLSVPPNQPEKGEHYLHPTLIDSITQLLAAFIIGEGNTFILKSIDRIEILETNFAETLWARATRRPGDANGRGFTGDIDVFDAMGKCYLELYGVAFSYLDRFDGVGKDPGQLNLSIASTFTAEPLEESLKFWADRFGAPLGVKFAPYNQVFQQLLEAESAFRKNNDGVNVILLGLEDWNERNQSALLNADRERLQKCFEGHLRYVLPNGLEIVHLNQYETDYLYHEIFHHQSYLRHGIRIDDHDTVIDIGANIGLFSLFALGRSKDARIYAFEPSPVVFPLLKANCEAYGPNISVFDCGVSDKPKTAPFTFYEKSSVFSGFHSDVTEDREAIEAVVRNMLGNDLADDRSLEDAVNELTAQRLQRRTFKCRLTSVSDIIRQNRIARVDLLKIDAEKSELDIIRGIDERHWPMIQQIVMEVHDRTKHAAELIEKRLTQKGYRCVVEQEKFLENSGLFNVYAIRDEIKVPDLASNSRWKIDAALKRNIDELCSALNSFMIHSKAPMLLCVCPRSPEARSRPEFHEILDAGERRLLTGIGKIANVRSIDSQSILDLCPLSDYYDSHSHQLGHVPYTAHGYAAIGTILFRTIADLQSKPIKVIVLDCDNVLWGGICGEDGPLGIQVDEPHRLLQEFMLEQMKRGLLICLCSKNSEKEVFDVFDQREEMILKREHLASWRVNWQQKSDNIEALAGELNLGLESFLFIDDNPVECAEVRIKCPEVLTLQLPQKGEDIPGFLNNIWGLKRTFVTAEDQIRTKMYQENIQREQFRGQTVSLKDFLNGLNLDIKLAAPTEDQISRVAQLTFKTNQFNFTSIRRSESEIRDWLAKEKRRCLAAHVKDRFGDYGLVGLLLFEPIADQLTVDTFLLSCRVLGRGVEHRMFSELGRIAERETKRFVELHYRPTDKNSPALDFINHLPWEVTKEQTGTLSVKAPAKELANLRYEPDEEVRAQPKRPAESLHQKPIDQAKKWFHKLNRSEVVQAICDELSNFEQTAKAIEDYRYRHEPAGGAIEFAPGDSLEVTLSKIWQKVLGRRQIGLTDNFFEAGGTSLKAVQVIALIQKQLKRHLSIVTLFECSTIKLLAAKLNRASDSKKSRPGLVEAQVRGRHRRQVKIRRKTALR